MRRLRSPARAPGPRCVASRPRCPRPRCRARAPARRTAVSGCDAACRSTRPRAAGLRGRRAVRADEGLTLRGESPAVRGAAPSSSSSSPSFFTITAKARQGRRKALRQIQRARVTVDRSADLNERAARWKRTADDHPRTVHGRQRRRSLQDSDVPVEPAGISKLKGVAGFTGAGELFTRSSR